MTQQRAMWENFGLRMHEMEVRDVFEKLAMLQVEARARQKNAEKH